MSSQSFSFALSVFYKHKAKSFYKFMNSIRGALHAKVRTNLTQSYIQPFLQKFNKLFSFFFRKH